MLQCSLGNVRFAKCRCLESVSSHSDFVTAYLGFPPSDWGRQQNISEKHPDLDGDLAQGLRGSWGDAERKRIVTYLTSLQISGNVGLKIIILIIVIM